MKHLSAWRNFYHFCLCLFPREEDEASPTQDRLLFGPNPVAFGIPTVSTLVSTVLSACSTADLQLLWCRKEGPHRPKGKTPTWRLLVEMI